MEKREKKFIRAFIIIFALFAIYLYFIMLLYPVLSDIRNSGRIIRKIKKEISELEKENYLLDTWVARLKAVSSGLVMDSGKYSFLKTIRDISGFSGVSIDSINIKNGITDDNFRYIQVFIQISGRYQSILDFIQRANSGKIKFIQESIKISGQNLDKAYIVYRVYILDEENG